MNSLTIEQARNIGEQIVKQEVFSVVLTGGEPFLNRKALYLLTDYLAKNNIDTAINSNLTKIKEDDVKKLKQKGILGILTSLCSYDEDKHDKITRNKGSFKQALKGIEIVQKHNMPLAVNMVVTKHNVDSVYKTGLFVGKELGIKAFNATPMNACSAAGDFHLDLTLSEEDYISTLKSLVALEKNHNMITDILEPVPHCLILHDYDLEKFLKRTCCAGVSTLAIGADSSVRPCTHSDQDYGNLQEKSMAEIWSSMEDWKNGNYLPKECEPCSVDILCRGACRTEALAYTGSLNGINPLYKEPLQLTKEKKVREGLDNKNLKFKQDIRYRKEDNNTFILYSPRDKFLEVSPEEIKYLSLLKSKYPSFTLEEMLSKETTTSKQREKLESFLSDLYHSEFIYSPEKHREKGKISEVKENG